MASHDAMALKGQAALSERSKPARSGIARSPAKDCYELNVAALMRVGATSRVWLAGIADAAK